MVPPPAPGTSELKNLVVLLNAGLKFNVLFKELLELQLIIKRSIDWYLESREIM